MAGIFEEIIGFERRRAYGGYALQGDVAPSTVFELEEALNAAEREEMLQEAYIGHVYKDGKDIYVDTAFINSVSSGAPGFHIKSQGFGEFAAVGPGGVQIELSRMRGRDFPGQSGRSHKMYTSDPSSKSVVTKLVKQMLKSGKAKAQKKLKVLSPKAMSKKTGMKLRAKARGGTQQKLYDFLMNDFQSGRQRRWYFPNDIARNIRGVHSGQIEKSLDAMVKSKLLDKGNDPVTGFVQYRLAESVKRRSMGYDKNTERDVQVLTEELGAFFGPAPRLAQKMAEQDRQRHEEESDFDLSENDLSILGAFVESGQAVMSAPSIAEVSGVEKSVVRRTLDEMSHSRLVARLHPASDDWKLTFFGESALSERMKRHAKRAGDELGESKGEYQAQGPLEKMVGEMVRGQSGKWLSKSQMKAIVKVLNKKGITKPSKDSYDDIARIVGKTLSALMKNESKYTEAKEGGIRYPNKKLGVAMHNWHSGQGDPIYGVGSMIFAGKPVSRDAVEDAIDSLEDMMDDFSGKEKKELKAIVSALKKGLKK